MIVSARENSPPAPSPWTARKAASCHISWASPHNAEPMTKTVMAVRKNGRRP